MRAAALENLSAPWTLAGFQHDRAEPPWLARTRRQAMARFEALGLPTTRLERWKYTNVAPLAGIPFEPRASAPRLGPGELAPLRLGAPELVFVNGRFASELSTLGKLPAGLRVSSLQQALRREPERLEPHLVRLSGAEASAFTELNTASFEDGAFLELAPGTHLREPIHLLFFSAADRPAVSHPRVLILAGERSRVSIVETYAGREGHVSLTNAVTEIAAGEAAAIVHERLQREGESAFHMGSLFVRQERDSRFTSQSLAFGAALARVDIEVRLSAPGAECQLDGLFVGRGAQHLDHHTTIDHAAPHGTSRELYKGILDGKSRGVFDGRILVRPDAQKTDALQTNKNLLLSPEALVESTPALEIQADDVRCKHGSTIGQLDADALFYLQSRGLAAPAARALLTRAFAGEIAQRVRVEPVRAAVESLLADRLPGEAS
jgi:Fe-S cluster assembly protein SufD